MASAPAFNRTQIYLAPTQQNALATLAKAMHSTSSALIRQAIDAFLAERLPADARARRLSAAGQWDANPDFDLRVLRDEERQF